MQHGNRRFGRLAPIRWVAALSAGIFLHCGGNGADSNGDGVADGVYEPNNVTVVGSTKPRGWVLGAVHDATTGLPIREASVVLRVGGASETKTTEADGGFEFGPLPAGAEIALTVSGADYLDASLSGLVIDDSAGNFPTDNGSIFVGPIRLLPSTGSFDVQVVAADGQAVAGASVTCETIVRFFDDTRARGTSYASAETGMDGAATVNGLANVWALPPSLVASAALNLTVGPVDRDGDGRADLRGRTIQVAGAEVRAQAGPLMIVLDRANGGEPLRVVGANIGQFISPNAPPTVLPTDATVNLAFNLPVDAESFSVNLRDESGDVEVPTSVTLGVLGNTAQIQPTMPLVAGQEYNLSLRVQSFAAAETLTLSAAAAFFVERDLASAITAGALFVDENNDNLWGTGADAFEVSLSTPVGRAGRTTAFVAQLYVDLDLNGSSTVGDSRGELPAAGLPYPEPLLVNSAEPDPGNGAPASGFTRIVAPRNFMLTTPLTSQNGAVDFELRLEPEDNAGEFILDPEGRPVPRRFTGSALLTSR